MELRWRYGGVTMELRVSYVAVTGNPVQFPWFLVMPDKGAAAGWALKTFFTELLSNRCQDLGGCNLSSSNSRELIKATSFRDIEFVTKITWARNLIPYFCLYVQLHRGVDNKPMVVQFSNMWKYKTFHKFPSFALLPDFPKQD